MITEQNFECFISMTYELLKKFLFAMMKKKILHDKNDDKFKIILSFL